MGIGSFRENIERFAKEATGFKHQAQQERTDKRWREPERADRPKRRADKLSQVPEWRIMPPSTNSVLPFTYEESSARGRARFANFVGLPIGLGGSPRAGPSSLVGCSRAGIHRGLDVAWGDVVYGDAVRGELDGSGRISILTPPSRAVGRSFVGMARSSCTEDTLMMRPLRPLRHPLAAAWQPSQVPVRLMATVSCQTSNGSRERHLAPCRRC